MQRDPNWSDEFAAQFLADLATDDGPLAPFVFAPVSEGSRDLGGNTGGSIVAETDPFDLIPVELDERAVYNFLSIASADDVVFPTSLRIFDNEGYLLIALDANDFSAELDGTDTVWQFVPSYTGTHYLSLILTNPSASADYGVAGEAEFGEIDEDTGNVSPVAADDALTAESFTTTLLDLVSGDVDEDGDNLAVIEIFERQVQNGDGVLETVPVRGFVSLQDDGSVLYRSPAGFVGTDTFVYRVSDGGAVTDTGIVSIAVSAGVPPADDTVTQSDAQQVAYLYEAALDRNGNIDTAGLNFWIDALASGNFTLTQIAAFFTRSPEYIAAFGNIDEQTDEAYVTTLYRNVLNREPDQAGFDFWLEVLEIRDGDRDQLLVDFARSGENLIGSPDIAEIAYVDPDGDQAFDWVV